MKKLFLLLLTLVISALLIFPVFAVEDTSKNDNSSVVSSENAEKPDFKNEKGNASEKTIGNVTSKEEKINEYTNKRFKGDRTNATVFYYLEKVKDYSVPVCFVGLVIASLNFFIIGNKKLDKREQGFKMLITLIIGLIVFQVLPFLFAIIVAGR